MTAVHLPDRLPKRLAPLGHHLALFGEALMALRGRLEKGRLPEPLAESVRRGLAGLPEAALPERLEVTVRVPEEAPEDWRVEASAHPWMVTPAACALLHLPGLRALWAGWLRGSVLEDLRRRLPRAWVVEHAVLPPQGAIAGLGLAAWGDFARLRTSGRAFEWRSATDEAMTALTPEADARVWQEAARRLAAALPGEAWVTELTTGSPARWQAVFACPNQRWDLVDLRAAS